jgi:hypothetical protein
MGGLEPLVMLRSNAGNQGNETESAIRQMNTLTKRPRPVVDAVIKRMLKTPPQPRTKKLKERPASKGRVHTGRTRR